MRLRPRSCAEMKSKKCSRWCFVRLRCLATTVPLKHVGPSCECVFFCSGPKHVAVSSKSLRTVCAYMAEDKKESKAG